MKKEWTYGEVWQEARSFIWIGAALALICSALIVWDVAAAALTGATALPSVIAMKMGAVLMGMIMGLMGYFDRRLVHHAILFHGAQPEDLMPRVSDELHARLKAAPPKEDKPEASSGPL